MGREFGRLDKNEVLGQLEAISGWCYQESRRVPFGATAAKWLGIKSDMESAISYLYSIKVEDDDSPATLITKGRVTKAEFNQETQLIDLTVELTDVPGNLFRSMDVEIHRKEG